MSTSPESKRAPRSPRGALMPVQSPLKKAKTEYRFRERIQPRFNPQSRFEERLLTLVCIIAQRLGRIETLLSHGGDDEH